MRRLSFSVSHCFVFGMRRMLTSCSCSCSCSCGDSCRFYPILSKRAHAPPCTSLLPLSAACWLVCFIGSFSLSPLSLSLPCFTQEKRVCSVRLLLFSPYRWYTCRVASVVSLPLSLCTSRPPPRRLVVLISSLSAHPPPTLCLCLCPRVICAPDGGVRLFSAHCAVLSFVNHRPSHRVRHCPCAFISRRLLSSVCRRRCRRLRLRPALPFVFASFVVSCLSCARERRSLLIDFCSPCVTGSCRDDRVSYAYGM